MAHITEQMEWLSLVDKSGPFLAPAVLEATFQQGLERVETSLRQRLRAAYDEWRDAVDEDDFQLAELHTAWIRMVFQDALEYEDEVFIPRSGLAKDVVYKDPEYGIEVVPDYVVRADDGRLRLLVSVYPPGTDLEEPISVDSWPASPAERLTLLCCATGVRLGIATNGEQWMLVNAPIGATSGYASWLARLWWQEPVTLRAFISLLGVRRCFGPPEDSLDQLLERSVEFQEETTDTLGEQVRRAVEVLIQALGRADQDRNGELLRDVRPAELYEAGLSVMMRLVFILCAEERGLLLFGDPTYDQYYAISTLRARLREDANQFGVDVVERRGDAWCRMLSVFRAVYGGVEHETLRMPALGGSLFDPDRFPFLEGRARGSRWREEAADPLPIDNHTVLLLLSALQVLEQRGGAQMLSYRALDVEQIGHVYEGLLEYTVTRTAEVMVALIGSQNVPNPTITLAGLETLSVEDTDAMINCLADLTGRGESSIRNALKRQVDEKSLIRLIHSCSGDEPLARRLHPFVELIRADAWGTMLIYRAGSFAITQAAGRRETGTHYTPRSLAENIVENALEPIVYIGPAEGRPRDEWHLKAPIELLDLKICDPAMGSGAFLVQVCRYLAGHLVEAWGREEEAGRAITVDGVVCHDLGDNEQLPKGLDDRLLIAKRLVAERCLYGVDLNPLAVELAKLSIWLVTLAKGHPFGFLDHNFRCGDSLLGIYRLDQLTGLVMNCDSTDKQMGFFGHSVEAATTESMKLRNNLRAVRIRDIHDIETMTRLDAEARHTIDSVLLVADAFVGGILQSRGKKGQIQTSTQKVATEADWALHGEEEHIRALRILANAWLAVDLPSGGRPRRPLHWPLEFPEVFQERGGFDALVGNPPFIGGQKITGSLGTAYRTYLVAYLANGRKGSADLCTYFFLRTNSLLRSPGQLGLLATNTIAQGDTREVGLQQLEQKGLVIYRAVPSRKWPGKANLEVAHVWLRKGEWLGGYVLDDRPANGITSYLTPPGRVIGNPYPLKANENKSFQGSIVLGMGFIMQPEEARALVERDPKNKDVLFPYLNGDDLNSRSDQSPSRWVINFYDWPLRRENMNGRWKEADAKLRKKWLQAGIVPEDYPGPVAADYPYCLRIVEEKVKPERIANNDKGAKTYWWRFLRPRPELYNTISDMERVLVIPETTKYCTFSFCPTGCVFSHMTKLITFDDFSIFAIIASSIHEVWAREYSSTLETRLKYITSDAFETFPFPSSSDSLELDGKCYHQHRLEVMLGRQEGLTKTYNRFHHPDEIAEDIQKLRDLHVDMDNVVAAAYAWDDLHLDHDFHETKQGIRFTISEPARREVLTRLLKLNHDRHREEVAESLQ